MCLLGNIVDALNPDFIFTMDGPNFAITEVDGVGSQSSSTRSKSVHALLLLSAGIIIYLLGRQPYSFIVTADQEESNDWIQTVLIEVKDGFANRIVMPFPDPVMNATQSVIPSLKSTFTRCTFKATAQLPAN
ncbi:hypothetical protein K438DRAFT_1984742 [Mycena galopus ATCC 62051]|nr:hypothetical protein K438DRAFT_1984742 [Mycena galopus ATCC 62051]